MGTDSKTPQSPPESSRLLKLVVVGHERSGKTCLTIVLAGRDFPTEENPQTAEDLLSTRKQAYVDGKEIELQFFDTTADEGHYDRLRPLAYPQTDIFIILFSVDVPDSLASVKSKWFPELSHYCPRVPIILVGNKTDLRRTDEGTSPAHVSPEQGASVATEIGAKYIECSAKTGLGMQDVLDLTLREGMAGHTYRRYKRPCIHCVVA